MSDEREAAMDSNVVHLSGAKDHVAEMLGPRGGHSVIIDRRVVPNLTAYEEGDKIVFLVGRRMAFAFDRDLAYYAASFAAEAMAVGAGFPSFRGERMKAFASPSGVEPGE